MKRNGNDKIYKPTKECPYPSKGLFRKNGKLYERVVYNDMVRDILIPDRKGNTQSTCFFRNNYNKLNKFANESKEDNVQLYIKKKKKESDEMEASAKRVEELRRYDQERIKGKIGYREEDLREEDNIKANYANARAKELIINQKDEMKMCNKFILEAKCQQIRKDQIAEQSLIRQEEKRLLHQENEVMIQKMLDEAVVHEKEKEQGQLKKKEYVASINSQLKENELKRQIELEQIAEEGRLNREASCQEMLTAVEERHRKKMNDLENAQKINDYNKNVISYMKAVDNEEKLLEERKIKEYHEEKERKEKEILEEKRKIQSEKQKIVDKIVANQMKSNEDLDRREQMHAQYVQDLVERKWRQKEKEMIEKKIKDKIAMMEARERQRRIKNELIAVETVALREDFNARMKVFDEQREKEKQEEEKRKAAAHKHRLELINQIHEKESMVIEERRKKFIEGQEIEKEREAELKEIRDQLERKLDTLKDHNLPDKALMDIRRRLIQHKILDK